MKRLLSFILLFGAMAAAVAQVTGKVIDAKTHEVLDFVYVYYEGRNTGEQTDENGRFIIREDSAWRELTVSSMGYEVQKVQLKEFGKNKNMTIRLQPEGRTLQGVTVSAKRKRYSRKNNPAVELMRKVIANKRGNDLRSKDFFSLTRYEKMVMSINEVSDKLFEEDKYKRIAFVKDHVERCPQTGKHILPMTVDETVSEVYYRKDPQTEKTAVTGERSKGVTEFVSTGDILSTMLKDVFTDVDIYDEECRLLHKRFKSPIANSAISFYRYYLQDTVYIDNEKCVDVGFLPNNQQDFGFSGHLYVLLTPDSAFQVRRVELSIPRSSDVNFVSNMIISQDYTQLPTGERVATVNDMLVELDLVVWMGKFQVQRVTRLSDISFEPIPKSVFSKIKGPVKHDPNAALQGEAFWNEHRSVELTQSEKKMDSFLDKMSRIKGFNVFLFCVKMFVENFVETGDSIHNYVDIGPVNTIISYNHYDSFRFRMSAITNANLSKHLFLKGYAAYGTKTSNIYGKLQATYSFNRKAYLPHEFPQRNVSLYYWDDVTSPFDKFNSADKDNMFLALKSNKVDQYNHIREWRGEYTYEHEDGWTLGTQFTRTRMQPVDALFYQRLGGELVPANDPAQWQHHIVASELKATLTYEPGVTYVNTKQRRVKTNHDAPRLSLSHTAGFNGLLGGQYSYHITEAGIWKRLWLSSWGKMEFDIKGGVQWSKVPFPFLIHPAANTSYFMTDNTFLLINNLEFLNDSYASMLYEWDLSGKIFNRIPLLRKLKWREMIGVNVLYGHLSSKNNPASSGFTDSDLFYFPGHFLADGSYEQNTVQMDPSKPYVEWRVGIHNIFKFLEVDYVSRINYRSNPFANKWGVRMRIYISF